MSAHRDNESIMLGLGSNPPPLQSQRLPLDAHNLLESVDDLNQVALRTHHSVNVFVSGWCLVNHRLVLTTLNSGGSCLMVRERELLTRSGKAKKLIMIEAR
jgi:hypothetical protein